MPDATPPRPLTAPDVVAGLLADVAERDERLAEVTAERDKAYRERAHLVAHLAACHPSVMLTDSAEPDWPIVFVSTSAGQMSWHIAKADLELFGHVPATTEPTWDGHTTEEKYQRLAELVRTLSYLGPPEQVDASIAEGKLEQLREHLGVIRDRLGNLAAGLDLSAAASRPSKKSEIESGCAQAVREIAASITVPDEGDDGSPAPKPVVIVFDINEGIQGWFHELANEVYAMSGETVVITEIDAEMSDVMIAVATRPVSVDEAIAIWHGDDEEPA